LENKIRPTLVNIVAVIAILSMGLLASCGDDASPIAPENSPPRVPHLLEPADSSDYTREYLTVSWECSDPDGDEVTYNVQLKENDDFVVYAGQTLLKTLDTGFGLLRNTMYTWRVVATDGLENSESDWWTFFTPDYSNEPPYPPADPSPTDGAINVQVAGVHLTWSANDPDEGDVLTYDLYFDTGTDPALVATGLTETSYALPTLDYDTVYFWRVSSTDSHGETTFSPTWTFTTRTQQGGLLARLGRLLGGE
jgi:hypothetical protein